MITNMSLTVGLLAVTFSSWLISRALTPFVIALASKLGILDRPEERKIHLSPIPRIGGVAIVVAWFPTILVLNSIFQLTTPQDSVILAGLMLGALTMAALGLFDDLTTLSHRRKFILEIIAISLFLGLAGPRFLNGFAAYVIAGVWLLGVTNAFNLIDGLDGLATGLATISAAGIAILAGQSGVLGPVIPAVALAGACLGFLPYNRHPAKVFMGDTGSLFLGFNLAAMSLIYMGSATHLGELLAPVFLLLLPLFDTLLAIVRRALNQQPLFIADKAHFYNLLMNRGFTHQGTVYFSYLLGMALLLSAVIMSVANNVIIVFSVAVLTGLLLALLVLKFRLFDMD